MRQAVMFLLLVSMIDMYSVWSFYLVKVRQHLRLMHEMLFTLYFFNRVPHPKVQYCAIFFLAINVYVMSDDHRLMFRSPCN